MIKDGIIEEPLVFPRLITKNESLQVEYYLHNKYVRSVWYYRIIDWVLDTKWKKQHEWRIFET